jgi:hypothetical protein
MSPTDAITYVLANAGASKVRDSVDSRLVQEVQSFGTVGELISDETAPPMNGPGTISGGTAPVDTDGDGMPDAYEEANGLNPNVNDAMDIASNGYASKCACAVVFPSIALTSEQILRIILTRWYNVQ